MRLFQIKSFVRIGLHPSCICSFTEHWKNEQYTAFYLFFLYIFWLLMWIGSTHLDRSKREKKIFVEIGEKDIKFDYTYFQHIKPKSELNQTKKPNIYHMQMSVWDGKWQTHFHCKRFLFHFICKIRFDTNSDSGKRYDIGRYCDQHYADSIYTPLKYPLCWSSCWINWANDDQHPVWYRMDDQCLYKIWFYFIGESSINFITKCSKWRAKKNIE